MTDPIETKARELCLAAGLKPDDLIAATIRKDDHGMPVSGFMPTWHCYRWAAEKSLEAA